MQREKKHHILTTLFLILVLKTLIINGAPTRNNILGKKDIPKYILKIYHQILTGQYELPPNVGAIHVFFANMKFARKLRKEQRSMRMKLSSNFDGVATNTRSVSSSLHLHISPRYTSTIKTQPFCKLTVTDVETGKIINSLKIPCYRHSSQIITMTSLVNRWLKHPDTNLGVRVRISSKHDKVPYEVLPNIESSNTSQLPYFVLNTAQ